jgi:hypothetical protein
MTFGPKKFIKNGKHNTCNTIYKNFNSFTWILKNIPGSKQYGY